MDSVLFELIKNEIRAILGKHIYAEGDTTLEEVIGQYTYGQAANSRPR